MPVRMGTGERIKSPRDTYQIEVVLNQGAFAHAARAKSQALGGADVFFKRYFSPTPALPWYKGFVEHQQELKRRITSKDSLRQSCYEFIEFFEGTEGRANKTFHQVFEFIANGKSLTKFLEEMEDTSTDWAAGVTFARVMMMGIAALHGERIVHTDLKPDNLLLIPNPHSAGRFYLKIIDLDFAIFSDQRAPWHGEVGYVGTPGYQSPEHLAGKVPTEASDVFTCALMLSELLGDGHPFRGKRGDDKSYAQAVREGDFARFSLRRPIDKVGDSARVEGFINRALDPIGERRPTAEELKDALFGREESKPGPEVVPPRPPPPPPSPKGGVELLFEGKSVLRLQIETMVGRQMLKPVSPDAQYFADAQYRIHRGPSGGWMVTPMPGTRNETLVDGRRLEAGMPLRAGMRIAVGNSAKGIEKLPLVVRMS